MNVESFLKDLFVKKNALVTERGNHAISFALEAVKTFLGKVFMEKNILLIPDQGGWISYPKLAKKCGFEVRELKTDRGVVILEELEKSLEGVSAFLFTGFAGYYAEQPIDDIIEICKKKDVFVINDCSGCFGSDLCKGDFLVSSFGKGKIVNFGSNGMICSDYKLEGKSVEYDFELIDHVRSAFQRLNTLMVLAETVKFDLKDLEIFHREKRGINVIVEYDEKVIHYCDKNNYEYVLCPKSFKVNEKAISIELKRLEI